MPYIIPRKKKENESRKENLARRLEGHIEFSHACGKMSLTSFFEELKDYIYHSNPPPTETKGVHYCDKHGGYGFVSDCSESALNDVLYVVSAVSCQDCNSVQVAVFDHEPTDDEKYAVVDDCGGMSCIDVLVKQVNINDSVDMDIDR